MNRAVYQFIVVVTGISLLTGCSSLNLFGTKQGKSELTRPYMEEETEKKKSFWSRIFRWGQADVEEEDTQESLLAAVAETEAEPDSEGYKLSVGDTLEISFLGTRNADGFTEVIDQSGMITLPYIGEHLALGKTDYDLEKSIRQAYIEGKIYRDLNVKIVVGGKFFYIKGEVKGPGRVPMAEGKLTLLQAITSAGGFSEYANPKKVRLIRRGKKQTVNVKKIEKKPENDILLEADDIIIVPRSIL